MSRAASILLLSLSLAAPAQMLHNPGFLAGITPPIAAAGNPPLAPGVAGFWTNGTTSANKISKSITVAGANSLLIFFSTDYNGTAGGLTSNVWQGVKATYKCATNLYTSGYCTARVDYIINPAAATANATSFWSATMGDLNCNIILITNAHQTSPVENFMMTNHAASYGATNVITSTTTNLILSFFGHNFFTSETASPGAGQTLQGKARSASDTEGCVSSMVGAAGSTTNSWNYAGNNDTMMSHFLLSIRCP